MKARSRKRTRKRARSPWLVMGAVLGTLPHLQAAERPSQVSPALPVAYRVTLDPRRVESALAHVKIWTPSETYLCRSRRAEPIARRQDSAVAVSPGAPSAIPDTTQSSSPQGPLFQLAIPSGQLVSAIRAFEAATGLTVVAPDNMVRGLTTEGVSGTLTAAQAMDRLLARQRACRIGSLPRRPSRSKFASPRIPCRSAAPCPAWNRRSTPRR